MLFPNQLSEFVDVFVVPIISLFLFVQILRGWRGKERGRERENQKNAQHVRGAAGNCEKTMYGGESSSEEERRTELNLSANNFYSNSSY